ncbi:hypothetical protein BHM03_00058119 [Ensete ventricosum]|nr:hypothetical protein BHM03_00058119 [Ensete ventricosum]
MPPLFVPLSPLSLSLSLTRRFHKTETKKSKRSRARLRPPEEEVDARITLQLVEALRFLFLSRYAQDYIKFGRPILWSLSSESKDKPSLSF